MTDLTAPADYEEATAWLLERLLDFMDATRELFDSINNNLSGWDQASIRMRDLYNSTLDDLTPVAERLRGEHD